MRIFNDITRNSISSKLANECIYTSYIEALNFQQQIDIKKVLLRQSIYSGDWADLLDIYLRKFIKQDEILKQCVELKDLSHNVVKYFIDGISTVYDEKPIRKFNNKNSELLYNSFDVNKVFKNVNRDRNLLNDVIVFVDWDYEKNVPYIRLLNRGNCDVILNRYYKEKIEKLIIYIDNDYDSKIESIGDAEKRTHYKIIWTEKEHYIEDHKGVKVDIPGRKKGDYSNPFGIIPAVDLHLKEIPGFFWNTINNEEIFDLCFLVAFNLTNINYNAFFNSFKMLVEIGEFAPGIVSEKAILSPGVIRRLNTLGSSGSVQVVDLNVDFKKLYEAEKFRIDQVLKFNGFEAKVDIESSQPGISIKLRESSKMETRRKQVPDFLTFEQRFFKILKIVWNYYRKETIPVDEELNITFKDQESFVDELEKLKTYKQKYLDGIISGGEFYRAFHPEITSDDDAEKMFNENVQKKQSLFGETMFNRFGNNSNLENNFDANDNVE